MKKALIIGAGPAGLTAAFELARRTDIKPIVFEAGPDVGGLSKTVDFNGNKIDIGGHRFFSKSDLIMKWWSQILPVQGSPEEDFKDGPNPDQEDNVMLLRPRSSRILFKRKFFQYPVSLNLSTLTKLGLFSTIKIAFSYLATRLGPNVPPKNLEDLFMHRFGKELYLTFFKEYTEKVWGIPCSRIKPEWGVQRIKNLSMAKTIVNALKKMIPMESQVSQQQTETSLITRFLYPKYGPGQLWQETAKQILAMGGEIHFSSCVKGIQSETNRIVGLKVHDTAAGKEKTVKGDYVFSSMSVQELIHGLSGKVPEEVSRVSRGLRYRDFVMVGLLYDRMKMGKAGNRNDRPIPTDQWIYIQERDVKVARVQLFNNWSPYLVKDKNTVWVGAEYFCNQGDNFWNLPEQELVRFAVAELEKIGLAEEGDFLDGTALKIPLAYPAYFGSYDRFDVIRQFTDSFENLFLIGRNGMHRYNNQDHSMLSAITAVENIIGNVRTKENIWAVNTEKGLHESKSIK
jgi:protoporphyrinogen oxidase